MVQKRFSLLAALLIAALVLAACPQPAPIVQTVQETVVVTSVVTQTETQEVVVTATPAPPTQGGVFVSASSADATILNPILSSDSASSGVHQFIYPSLIGGDPFSGEIVPTELAESWSTSDDGLVWTFVLRQDMTWSDGQPVTAHDFKFTYEAIAAEAVETPRKSNVELIESIETPDDYTVVVTFSEVKCDGLSDLGLGILRYYDQCAERSAFGQRWPLHLQPMGAG